MTIEQTCHFCDEAFSELLEVYQMFDWKMSWQEFIRKAEAEFSAHCYKWEQEEIE